jgi:hypothetical protein
MECLRKAMWLCAATMLVSSAAMSVQVSVQGGTSRSPATTRQNISPCAFGAKYFARFVSLRDRGFPEESFLHPDEKDVTPDLNRARKTIVQEIWSHRDWDGHEVTARYMSRCQSLEKMGEVPRREVQSLVN